MKNPVNALITYVKSSYQEMKKVTWPNKKETTNHTLLVIGISLGVAVFLGIADYFLSMILENLLK